jgi:hypothetical protein
MKKTALSLALILLCSITLLKAQVKQIAEGPVFEQPDEGFAKILQFKNGSTMYIYVDVKKGIDIHRYDPSHKETATNHINPSYGKLKNGAIKGAFEINGDAVILVSEIDGRVPALYRLIVDGKTGNLKDDSKIAELNKMSMFSGYSVVFGNVPMPDFFVRKDPDSDNYAVAMFNSFESDRSKRIEIASYGPDNKEVARAFYASPDEKYKYLRYIDMAVIGNEKVCVLAYAYNTKSKGGDYSDLILANLDKGAKAVSFTELGYTQGKDVSYGLTRYSPVLKQIILSVVVKDGRDYVPMLGFVNPFEKKLNRLNYAYPSTRVVNFSKHDYKGLPVNLVLNVDGTFTIISEELSITTVTYSGINYGAAAPKASSSLLGNMAIVNYSKTGEFINDFLIRKSHDVNAAYLTPYYHSIRQGTGQMLYKGNEYKSFDFISAGARSYIVFNDTERNNDAQEQGGLVTIEKVDNCDAFAYAIKGTDVVPKRDYIFGNPEKRRDHNLLLFSIADYDAKSNIYTTLKLEKEGGNKGVKLVWLQP